MCVPVCDGEDRWTAVRCCGSLNTDEGQTEGWLASGLLCIFPCCSHLPLSVWLFLQHFQKILSLWALIISLPSSHLFSVSVPLLLSVVKVERGRTITITKDELEGENAFLFYFSVWLKEHEYVLLAFMVPPCLWVATGSLVLMHLDIIFNCSCSNCLAEAASICSIYRSKKK